MKTIQLPSVSASGHRVSYSRTLRAVVRNIRYSLLLLLALLASPARAQFSAAASTTQFVCNAPGVQFGVQAFADGVGGAYQVWIDKRGGNNSGPGTALYAQHLNAAGVPLLPANGLRLFQTQGRDIFGMRAIPWQTGILVTWVQGAYSIGGDSVRCQFYNAAGVAQWARPALVAYRTPPTVVYVTQYGLNIFTTSAGATITYNVSLVGGGNDRLGFNQVNAAGALRYPNNQNQLPLPSANSLLTLGDGGDGFYVVCGYGGFGSPIYAQHYDLNGTGWPALLDLTTTTGASGRGGQDWRAVRDPAGNLYVVWGSDSNDILAIKVTPAGALGWSAPGYRTLSSNPSRQNTPDALWHNNALLVIWNDDLLPASFQAEYVQRVDAAGTLAWPATGVLINDLPGVFTYPKLAASDNGAVMAFYSTAYGQGFRAQKIRPDASVVFPVNGVVLHNVVNDQPNELDYVPVSQPNGSVQVFWSSVGTATTGRDICAGRMQNSGTLLGAAERRAAAVGFEAYPNPARTELYVQFPTNTRPTQLRLYNAQGRVERVFAEAEAGRPLLLRGLAPGLYALRATVAGQQVSRCVVVE